MSSKFVSIVVLVSFFATTVAPAQNYMPYDVQKRAADHAATEKQQQEQELWEARDPECGGKLYALKEYVDYGELKNLTDELAKAREEMYKNSDDAAKAIEKFNQKLKDLKDNFVANSMRNAKARGIVTKDEEKSKQALEAMAMGMMGKIISGDYNARLTSLITRHMKKDLKDEDKAFYNIDLEAFKQQRRDANLPADADQAAYDKHLDDLGLGEIAEYTGVLENEGKASYNKESGTFDLTKMTESDLAKDNVKLAAAAIYSKRDGSNQEENMAEMARIVESLGPNRKAPVILGDNVILPPNFYEKLPESWRNHFDAEIYKGKTVVKTENFMRKFNLASQGALGDPSVLTDFETTAALSQEALDSKVDSIIQGNRERRSEVLDKTLSAPGMSFFELLAGYEGTIKSAEGEWFKAWRDIYRAMQNPDKLGGASGRAFGYSDLLGWKLVQLNKAFNGDHTLMNSYLYAQVQQQLNETHEKLNAASSQSQKEFLQKKIRSLSDLAEIFGSAALAKSPQDTLRSLSQRADENLRGHMKQREAELDSAEKDIWITAATFPIAYASVGLRGTLAGVQHSVKAMAGFHAVGSGLAQLGASYQRGENFLCGYLKKMGQGWDSVLTTGIMFGVAGTAVQGALAYSAGAGRALKLKNGAWVDAGSTAVRPAAKGAQFVAALSGKAGQHAMGLGMGLTFGAHNVRNCLEQFGHKISFNGMVPEIQDVPANKGHELEACLPILLDAFFVYQGGKHLKADVSKAWKARGNKAGVLVEKAADGTYKLKFMEEPPKSPHAEKGGEIVGFIKTPKDTALRTFVENRKYAREPTSREIREAMAEVQVLDKIDADMGQAFHKSLADAQTALSTAHPAAKKGMLSAVTNVFRKGGLTKLAGDASDGLKGIFTRVGSKLGLVKPKAPLEEARTIADSMENGKVRDGLSNLRQEALILGDAEAARITSIEAKLKKDGATAQELQSLAADSIRSAPERSRQAVEALLSNKESIFKMLDAEAARSGKPRLTDAQKQNYLEYLATVAAVKNLGRSFPSSKLAEMVEGYKGKLPPGTNKATLARNGLHEISTVDALNRLSQSPRIGDLPRSMWERIASDVQGTSEGSGLPTSKWRKQIAPNLVVGKYPTPTSLSGKLLAFADKSTQTGLGVGGGAEQLALRNVGSREAFNTTLDRRIVDGVLGTSAREARTELGEMAKKLSTKNTNFAETDMFRKADQSTQNAQAIADSIQWNKEGTKATIAGREVDNFSDLFAVINDINTRVTKGDGKLNTLLSQKFYSDRSNFNKARDSYRTETTLKQAGMTRDVFEPLRDSARDVTLAENGEPAASSFDWSAVEPAKTKAFEHLNQFANKNKQTPVSEESLTSMLRDLPAEQNASAENIGRAILKEANETGGYDYSIYGEKIGSLSDLATIVGRRQQAIKEGNLPGSYFKDMAANRTMAELAAKFPAEAQHELARVVNDSNVARDVETHNITMDKVYERAKTMAKETDAKMKAWENENPKATEKERQAAREKIESDLSQKHERNSEQGLTDRLAAVKNAICKCFPKACPIGGKRGFLSGFWAGR